MTLAVLLAAALVLGGCAASETRNPRSQDDLVRLRMSRDAASETVAEALFTRLIERSKAQYDQYSAGIRPKPPVIDILILSGGGDWGAFGAGFLKGWMKVPPEHPLAKPEFDAVTGVSTGALIAPFAFLGDEPAVNQIVNLYRNPRPDWVKQRGMLYFLPHHVSLAEVPGLERELVENMKADTVQRIAAAGADGRILVVNATNLDATTPRMFDLVAEAEDATSSKRLGRIHNILLASAGIPGVVPFRIIEDELYVDGGVTGNIMYGGRLSEEDSLAALWQKTYQGVPVPKIRYWVIFNNQFRPVPQRTVPRWPPIIQRSLHTASRAATANSVRHLFAMAEISRLKRGADVEVRVVSSPGDWAPPVPGVFIKETMNNLADLGERMGADPASWSAQPPPY
jgi:hypothetical protein